MGSRHPDNVRSPPMPAAAVTLGEMREAGWIVTALCPACRTRLHVDLPAMIRLLGPDYVLWGRRPRCRVWAWTSDARCEGRVVFHAQSIQGGSFRPLTMTGEVRDALRLRSQADHRRG